MASGRKRAKDKLKVREEKVRKRLDPSSK